MGDKSYDPLIIEDFAWGNEWVDPTIPPAQCARGCPNDISWDLVDEAAGASSQRKRSTPSQTFHHEDDEDDDQEQHSSIPNGEDDDSYFPQDDVAVTDDEEDPTSVGQDGEGNTNATMDEFDDGY
ncbi:hypothetical protein ZWY2020_024291 [Hordeum vulgare]|nr:hypothetical protein ZWY2020_024291 [Hordeum vulgare]